MKRRNNRGRAPSPWYQPVTPPTASPVAPSTPVTPKAWRPMHAKPAGSWSHFERFNTLTEAIEIAKCHKSGHEEDRYFAGGTHDEAMRFAVEGWPEGAALASTIAGRIANRILQSKAGEGMDLRADVAGAAYDVSAYLSGVPECWIMPVPSQPRRAVSIGYNVSVSAAISAETLQRRGIAVLALALALNAKGYPVTIDLFQATDTRGGGSGGKECFVTRVADASTGSQLDVDRLSFALGHPTMFRQVYASLTGSHWSPCKPLSDTYPHDAQYDVKIGGAHADEAARWMDGGEAWVLAQYEAQTAEG